MAENGATNILFLSRSTGQFSLEDPFFRELKVLGCTAHLFAGIVSNIEDVKNVVKHANKPIAGVIQASVVLKVKYPLQF